MRNFVVIAGLLIFLFSTEVSFAQPDCRDYHSSHCKFNTDPDFKYSGQSRSGRFVKGQTSSFGVIVYGGRDYSFSICSPRRLKDVEFRIKEDTDSQQLIYSNAEDGYAKMKTFSVETTKKLIIEVVVPGGDDDRPTIERRTYCVGVLIEYKKTSPKGF